MRPEDQVAELFYDDQEASKYTESSRIQKIQVEMTDRAVELLAIPADNETPLLILDIGCGSGLSGEILTEYGHEWIGVDISLPMLDVALEREVEGDLMCSDIGYGLSFRPGAFDAVVSISCLQWLCVANTTDPTQTPHKRMHKFFTDLYNVLKPGARAVFQLYPDPKYDTGKGNGQMELLMTAAMRCGFGGGLVVDYPNSTKRRKFFLCLIVGGGKKNQTLPAALDDSHNTVKVMKETQGVMRRERSKKRKPSHKEWIAHKKEVRRNRGDKVAADSKYTGRKRSSRF